MSEQKVTTNQEMLIRLDERVLTMSEDVKEIKTNQALQLAKFEARLIALETFIQTKATESKLKEWNDAAIWVQDFRKTWILITGFVGVVAGIIGYLLNTVWAWFQNRGG